MKFKIGTTEKKEKVITLYLKEGQRNGDVFLCGKDTYGFSNVILIFRNGKGYRPQMDGNFVFETGLKIDEKNQLVLCDGKELEYDEREEN